MPTREAPADVNDPTMPPETNKSASATAGEEPLEQNGSAGQEPRPAVNRYSGNSRWVDYDTHELLTMISELEDERRWARLREGALWAVLVHFAVLLGLFLLPKYVFKVPPVVDKTAIINKDEFTYLDTPRFRPKVEPKPLVKQPQIDRKTLESLRKSSPPPPAEEAKAPEPPPTTQPAPPPPIPPQPQSQSQLEVPKPPAVPARPNFALGSQNPADQLRDAMKNAARSHGQGDAGNLGPNAMPMHPGAGTGGVQVLSDTQGVDFSGWLQRWHYETERTWDPLIPDEVNPPIYKSGMVAIRFKVLPNGRLMEGSLVLEGRSGDVALDRAAWGALTGSNYPPLPRDFHGPYLELRAYFLYNMQPR
jgi:outer membrane biosynthesis protein TonB